MNTKNILLYAGLLVLGLFLGYLFFGGTDTEQPMDEHIEEAHTDEQGNVVYTCSMHPQVRQNEPGNCPICGMELIPAEDESEQSAADPNTLTMTQASMKLAEIQTTPVIRDQPVSTFTLPGKVTENQNNVSNVTAHFPGRIRNLYVDYAGTYVREGQRLASIYSPELIAAQQELLETAKYKNQNPRLYEAARRKLMLWEFPESTINQIEQSGEIMNELDFYSPVSGYVSELAISREDHVMEGGMLYRIVDLSTVWVDFQAFESNISSIQEGDQIQFAVEALPGHSFESTVIYVDPFLDNQSRTATIRARVQNPNNQLKPGMLATAEVESDVSGEFHLMVPRSAIMWTGKRSIVYVQIPNTSTPSFQAKEVMLGNRAGNYYVVESGLSEGEQVVTNGTFKIDSAAQLSDKLSMMNREPGTGANRSAHDHGSIQMDQNSNEDHSQHQQMDMQSNQQPEKQQSLNIHSQQDLESVMPAYLETKEALANDDYDEANTQLRSFTDIRTNNIEELRAAFKQVSEELVAAVEEFGYEGTLYKQFCPMYGGGSLWISDSEGIQNPYYGNQMHNCGETVEAF
ncbi:efflux RND transporter periplasmic adaptor subunit [Rhodohalobacter sp. 614A]|uniref:efflux RND transporter periplasmic adaptor subunit n=1 Tax=Rhodohalobacter sp. 614A TaxID=2908649 RepID=UPI001F27C42C|nr:efflux RND transporter periplasmic adaptor subunit [Rhodohalobacter sp. 614A]